MLFVALSWQTSRHPGLNEVVVVSDDLLDFHLSNNKPKMELFFFIGDSTIEPIDESLFIEKHGGYASARWPATFMCPWLSCSH
jgi:hypothetical protein